MSQLVHLPNDGAGNLLNDGRHTYQYDSENHITAVTDMGAAYTYGAQGERIRKDQGSTWTEYIYFNGQPIAEKTASGWTDYIFANGKRIARATGQTSAGTVY